MTTTATLPHITKRQQDILRLLYEFRFLNRPQIQTLMGHKDKRLINAWLKDLWEKSYVAKQYSKSFPENTKPASYCSGPGAISYLRALDDTQDSVIQRLYRDRTRTRDFSDACMLVADIAIELRQAESRRHRYEFISRSSYANLESGAHFMEESEVSPDAVILYNRKGQIYSYLLQIIPRNYPPRLAYAKVQNYLNFYFNSTWQSHIRISVPTVLFVFTNYAQLRAIKRYTDKKLDRYDEGEIQDFQVDFLLASQIKKNGIQEYF